MKDKNAFLEGNINVFQNYNVFLPYLFCCKTAVFPPIQNSLATDLEFWDCFESEKPI